MSSIPPVKLKPYDVKEGENYVGIVILGRQTDKALPPDVLKHAELTFIPDENRTPKYYMSIEQHVWFREQWRNRAFEFETLTQQLAETQMHWEEALKEIERLSNKVAEAQSALETAQQSLRRVLTLQSLSKPRDCSGFVYVLKEINGTHYKIGRTVDPDNRLRTFSVKLPFPVKFEHLIKCEDMYALERELHKRFLHKHINGEWFALDNEDLEYIRSVNP